MKRPAADWLDLIKAVGRAFLDLVRSEFAALGEDLTESGRRLGIALGLLLLAFFVIFWAVGALGLLLVEVLDLWLPRWGAVATLLAILCLTAGILAVVARQRMRRIDKPAATVARRIAQHSLWWDQNILDRDGEEAPDELPPAEEESV